MRDHEPGCPRLQFWDAGEAECPCTCGDPAPKPIADRIRDVVKSLEPVLDHLTGYRPFQDDPQREPVNQAIGEMLAIASEIEEMGKDILKRCPAERGFITHFIHCEFCRWSDSLARRKDD